MTAEIRHLFPNLRRKYKSDPPTTATVTIDIGERQNFLAWGTITFLDSLVDFDRDNAVAIDITHVDPGTAGGPVTQEKRTQYHLHGGDHLGDKGAESNLHAGAVAGFGTQITFRMRAFHPSDFQCFGTAIVITDP